MQEKEPLNGGQEDADSRCLPNVGISFEHSGTIYQFTTSSNDPISSKNLSVESTSESKLNARSFASASLFEVSRSQIPSCFPPLLSFSFFLFPFYPFLQLELPLFGFLKLQSFFLPSYLLESFRSVYRRFEES